MIPAAKRRSLRRALLGWFDRCRRDMPWRRTHDPYAIWVSEIMLQQTRVAAATDYYMRFLERFPTVHALADAPLDDVLKLWEGLGYYSRARNLHAAAKVVATDLDGRLPDTVEGLRALPGIGPYTAGAIASIAFDRPEPVLDGNVTRVLCRLFRIDAPPTETAVKQHLWDLAGQLLGRTRPGDFNQAMMELGATVCTPRRPNCDECPAGRHCLARSGGVQEQLPTRPEKKSVPHQTIVAAVIARGRGRARRILIDRRKPGGMLGGLWEFPGGKVEPGETHAEALRPEVREEVGLAIRVGRPICQVEHAYSHFRITLHAYAATVRDGEPRPIECDAVRWVAPDALRDYAFPKANHAILEAIGAGAPSGKGANDE